MQNNVIIMTTILSQNQMIDYDFIRTLKNISPTLKDLKNTIKQIWTLKMQIQKLDRLEASKALRIKLMN